MIPVPAAVPVLWRVRVCAALVTPTALVKDSGPPVTLSVAPVVPEPQVLDRAGVNCIVGLPVLPKKSVAGASV